MRMGAFDHVAATAIRLTDTYRAAHLRNAVIAGCAMFWLAMFVVLLG